MPETMLTKEQFNYIYEHVRYQLKKEGGIPLPKKAELAQLISRYARHWPTDDAHTYARTLTIEIINIFKGHPTLEELELTEVL